MCCSIHQVPNEIFGLIGSFMPTKDLLSLSSSCKKLRNNKQLTEITFKRLGFISYKTNQLMLTWKNLSLLLKKEIPKHPFPFNFAERNLKQIPLSIITPSLIRTMKAKENISSDTFTNQWVFHCGLTVDGMVVTSNAPGSIAASIQLTRKEKQKNPQANRIYKMLIIPLNNHADKAALSERGKKILDATSELFNDIFTCISLEKKINHPQRFYQFLCNAERPHALFDKKIYSQAINKKSTRKRIRSKIQQEEPRNCSIQ